MRNVLFTLLALSARATADEQNTLKALLNNDDAVDKLVDHLANKLLGRMPVVSAGRMPLASAGFPSLAKPAQATSGAHSATCGALKFNIQAYSPFDGKKYETLSYLPQISNQDIEKQISYMIRNSWTPGLEFSQDGDVYLNTRMGPGYYDNRYWSMYKLPMFGCTDPSSVVREIENCSREFPGAKVRVIAYDSIKQVQVAGFIVRK